MKRVGRCKTEPEMKSMQNEVANFQLYLAAVNGNYETALAAIERGADVNYTYSGPSKDPNIIGRNKVELTVSRT